MGGGGSKPAAAAPQKLIVEDPQPTGSTAVQIQGSDAPVNMPVDGVSIATAQGCDRCALYVVPDISTSTVKLTREFGDISYGECKRFQDDQARVRAQTLAFSDFKSRLQAGEYYDFLSNRTHCRQVQFDSETLKKVTDLATFDANKGSLQSVRIRKISSGGFSRDTKIQITPSIPLKMSVSVKAGPPREIVVSQMTLYHPSPMRIENVQHDAVLSLNDPVATGPGGVVVLIPLVAGSADTSSSTFMSRILGNISQLLQPDPVTGVYPTIDAPTGANWTLNTLLPTDPETNAVQSGIFVWEGTPELERYVSEDTPYIQRTSWRRRNVAAPMYVMLEKPLTMANADFTNLLQFPVTPPEQAIHEMLAGSLTYKCGPTAGGTAPTGTESFTNREHYQSCDPFMPNYTKNYGYSPETMFRWIFALLFFVALGLGVWAALILVGDLRMDQFFQSMSFTVGKVIVRLFKGLQNVGAAARGLAGRFGSSGAAAGFGAAGLGAAGLGAAGMPAGLPPGIGAFVPPQ